MGRKCRTRRVTGFKDASPMSALNICRFVEFLTSVPEQEAGEWPPNSSRSPLNETSQYVFKVRDVGKEMT